jgi:hypothetical protein
VSFVRVVWKGGAAVDVRDGVAPLRGLARKQIEMTPTCGSGGTEYRKAADPCSQVCSAATVDDHVEAFVGGSLLEKFFPVSK